jgi:hypothetical protein
MDPRYLAAALARPHTYIVVIRAVPSFAAEFPNDNAELHRGTIWMCTDVCGPAEPRLPASSPEEVSPDEALPDDEGEPIEIVESIELEGPIEIVPAPLESGLLLSSPDAEEEPERIVALGSTPPPPTGSPFAAFLQTLSDVACDAGHTYAASEIEAALADDTVALAWRAILDGESEDFARCAEPLDEWASSVLARFLATPHRAPQLRRELRARGVAAFGIVEAA